MKILVSSDTSENDVILDTVNGKIVLSVYDALKLSDLLVAAVADCAFRNKTNYFRIFEKLEKHNLAVE
jgi:hypothetical protein